MWNLNYDTYKLIYGTKHGLRDTENRLVVATGNGLGRHGLGGWGQQR